MQQGSFKIQKAVTECEMKSIKTVSNTTSKF